VSNVWANSQQKVKMIIHDGERNHINCSKLSEELEACNDPGSARRIRE